MRFRRPATVCLLLAVAVGAAACSSDGGSGAAATTTTAIKAPSEPPYAMKQITLHLVDKSRPTPRNGSYAGAPTRTLDTLVSLPVGADLPLPFVVFSTGIDGTATNYEGLYKHWVENGYAVAAPVFPLSNKNAPGGSTISDFSSQPGDVRFVLDELVRMSAAKKGALAGKLDPARIALAGKSLGALTTLRAAFYVPDHETRENAVISLTGGGDGSSTMFTGIIAPLLLIHGDADKTIPYQSSVRAFASAMAPKFFVTLNGEDHGGAFNGEDTAAGRVVVASTLDFLDAYLRSDPTALGRLSTDATVAKVASIQAKPTP
jgi:dienelactone hydrolase